MEQFKHLQLPASIKKHYVKLVATGIIIVILLIMCLYNTGADPIDTDYFDSIDNTDTDRLA